MDNQGTFSNDPVTTDQIPQYQEISLTPLPREATWVALISWLIFFAIAVVASIIGRLLNLPLFIDFLLPWILSVVTFVVLMMLWTAYSYRFRGYALREHDLLYRRGVIWQKTTILPFNRVQHVETQQGVLQRKFNITTLNLFTAGGQRADLAINGMNVEVTEGIKTMLLARIQAEQISDD